MTSILLIGAPGTGKTAVAAQLGHLGWTAGDTGQALAHDLGMDESLVPIEVPFERRIAAERTIFSRMLSDVQSNSAENFAIAVGSEVLGDLAEDTEEISSQIDDMRNSKSLTVVQLTANITELVKRNGLVGQRSAGVIMPRKNFREMLDRRRPHFDSISDIIVDTGELSAREAVEFLISELNA